MQEDKPTLHQLEQAVRLAAGELMKFTGFDGFVLEMPTGDDRPPHLIVVGTAAEIRWLLDQRTARQHDAGQAPEAGDPGPGPERH